MINEYASKLRRQLHMYPETGFNLEKTLALLRAELADIGVPYTEKYGQSSIVATINPEKTNYTIGIRADTDALPIKEENDVPYRSRIDGNMHACGHDAHTAIALTTLRELYREREKLNCRIMFLFQSGEEAYCGAQYMAQDGVMRDIDCILALHVDPTCKTGQIAVSAGAQNANADHFTLEFFGKAVHAAHQEKGIDANMVALKTYMAIECMLAKELAAQEVAVFNAGEIRGGTASNIISDYCLMNCTLRTWTGETEKKLLDGIRKTAEMTADISGAKAVFTMTNHYPVLINSEEMTEKLRLSAIKAVGAENVLPRNGRSMGGEDFAFFANEKSACMFRLGVAGGGTAYGIHTSRFDIDENALDVGVRIFKQFVYDHMNDEKV